MRAVNHAKPACWTPIVSVYGDSAGSEVVYPSNVWLEVWSTIWVKAFHVLNSKFLLNVELTDWGWSCWRTGADRILLIKIAVLI